MATYGWNIIIAKPLMPYGGDTVNGQPFTVPRNTQAITIICPSLVAGATLKLQTLDPQTANNANEFWADLKVYNIFAGGVQPVTAIPSGVATTLPVAATGGGVLRFVASSDQSSTPINISVLFTLL